MNNKRYDPFGDIILVLGPLFLLFVDIVLGEYNVILEGSSGSTKNGLRTILVLLDYKIGQTSVRVFLLTISIIFFIKIIYKLNQK